MSPRVHAAIAQSEILFLYVSVECKIEKSELQTRITADVEHQIKQLVAKFGEKKVREVLDPLINEM